MEYLAKFDLFLRRGAEEVTEQNFEFDCELIVMVFEEGTFLERDGG